MGDQAAMYQQGGQYQGQGQPMYPMQGQVVQGQVIEPGQYGEGQVVKGYIAQASQEVRSGFIRKVYSILSVQLAITFGFALYMNTSVSPLWAVQHRALFQVASFGTLALMMGVSCCCPMLLRQFPINYVILFLFTLGMSAVVGFVSILYTTQSVLMVLATTAIVFGGLTAYACTTQTDFTGMGSYLMAGCMALCAFGFVLWLWPMITGTPSLYGTPIHKVYAGLGVLLFVFYIIYDTQLIVGGTHKKVQFEVDDYCLAALNLYLDVINLFLYLLELFGDRR